MCVLLLALGYARLAPGARIESARDYRIWSFGAFAYSDIIALHDDRGGGRHRLPYLEDRIEYPVLLVIHSRQMKEAVEHQNSELVEHCVTEFCRLRGSSKPRRACGRRPELGALASGSDGHVMVARWTTTPN